MGAPNNEPAEPVYEDFRQLLALTESRAASNSGLLRRVTSRTKRALESLAGFLETRTAMIIAALLCVGLGAFSWMGIRQTQPQRATTAPVEPLKILQIPVEQASVTIPASAEQAYVVRVGSFRDPANAARIAESLRLRTSDVRTGESAGLYVVELGPFPHRRDAEDSAQELAREAGLTPQIVRQK